MEWYYAADQRQQGPVSEARLQELIRTGIITSDVLVWRDGMTEWQPLSTVRPGGGHLAPLPVPPANLAVCSQCGRAFPVDETIRVGGQVVCAACKPLFLQKLQEGVPTAGRQADLGQVLAIAQAQKGVIWCIPTALACYVGVIVAAAVNIPALSLGSLVAALAVMVFQVLYVYRLAAALRSGPPILWVLGILLCSWIGLILMLVLSSQATSAIRKAGFKVGIMGADLNEIRAAMG